jgi:DinB superfamily
LIEKENPMITARERATALELLARSRQTLLDAVQGVTETQARWKPAADRWTVLEYVEHLAVSDDALVELVRRSLESPPQLETEGERRDRAKKIRETPIPRGVNRAPDGLKPNGRFASLDEAVSHFLAARERTIEYASNTQADLRRHFTYHPVLGPLDAYQWLVGNARHAETHAGHIREIRAMDGFPAEERPT